MGGDNVGGRANHFSRNELFQNSNRENILVPCAHVRVNLSLSRLTEAARAYIPARAACGPTRCPACGARSWQEIWRQQSALAMSFVFVCGDSDDTGLRDVAHSTGLPFRRTVSR